MTANLKKPMSANPIVGSEQAGPVSSNVHISVIDIASQIQSAIGSRINPTVRIRSPSL